jgi:predicted membrane-bound spermidine synthase
MKGPGRLLLFVVFTVSGFTGLIYESLWTHYLKLFLGHAAYAQALVLGIFMGGLAVGSWICSRWSGRWRNLLRGYAVTEGAVGLFAIGFHLVFTRATGLSYDAVLPALGSPAAASLYKWLLSALLILPQTILLGMTFPLMVAAFVRAAPETPGRSIALLYFTNSVGAAVGVLVSGFLLVGLLGLPGTMALAGSVNLVIAVVVWWAAGRAEGGEAASAATHRVEGRRSPWHGRLLLVSALTGTASFVYEVGWIRMLSLVLGSSTHAFELMLSAFIFGLAFGGLWIHRRVDATRDPRRLLALVQIAMGLLALGTLPLYGRCFEAMRWLVGALPRTDLGWVLFNLSSNGIALAIMLPATFCAGMTLPLITASLLKDGSGEGSIGAVYAWNTVGAIAGVFLAIHVGMPALGLKGLLVTGASLDLSLGVLLSLWLARSTGERRLPAVLGGAAVAGVAAAALLVRFDPYLMASGVYRSGKLLSHGEVELLFHRDGKTATITVERRGDVRGVRTNGKPDSALSTGPVATADEPTMILAGALPVAYHPEARTAANIGLGSGLTTHTLLQSPGFSRVDTIEIEREMIEGARLLSSRVGDAFADPRSRQVVDDAKTFFSVQDSRYDVIVSEPSNPWVSGVAGLFSTEFYRLVTRHLSDDGVFVQWVQLYEIDEELVASVMRTLAPFFADYEAYVPNSGDMLIVARKKGRLPPPSFAALSAPGLALELARIGIRTEQDLALRRLGGKRELQPMFERFGVPPNSDYHPFIEQRSAKTRFLGSSAEGILSLTVEPLPVLDVLGGFPGGGAPTAVTPVPFNLFRAQRVTLAMALRDFLVSGRFAPGYDTPTADGAQATAALRAEYAEAKEAAAQLERLFYAPWPQGDPNRRIWLFNAAKSTFPYLNPAESEAIWRRLEAGPRAGDLSQVERDYVTLFKAVGRRDAAGMKAVGTRLLETERDITPARLRYVLGAALLGNVGVGTEGEAERLWSRYGPAAAGSGDPGMLYRLLLARIPAP